MNTNVRTQTFTVPNEHGGTTAKETVFYPEVLAKGHNEGLCLVRTMLVQTPFDENGHLAIVKASVKTSKGVFQAYGDASPDSVESTFVPHLIRVAETRAKARALRDAVNVGVVAYEELNGATPIGEAGNGGTNTSVPVSVIPSSGSAPMTEGQRRYLFRLMAVRGFRGDAAQEELKRLLKVSVLTDITKAAAGQMIDHLLHENGESGGNA